MRTLRALAIASVLAIGCPLLAACSVIDTVVHDATGQDLPDGLTGGASVPDDFPAAVPLIDGDVVFGLSLPADDGHKTWNVTIDVTGPDAFDTIKTQLTEGGFEYSGGTFHSGALTVLVAVVAVSGDRWTANYTVTDVEVGE
jgi:hypothetical protein